MSFNHVHEHENGQRREMEEAGNEDDIHLCLICLSHIRDIVFLECGHLLFCENCVIFYQRCPVCDVKVKTWQKVLWDI